MSIDDLTIVVTGGTGGLGRAVVAAAVSGGARVAVPRRSARSWEGLLSTIDARFQQQLWGAEADLTDTDSATRFMEGVVAEFGRVDAVAALAGGYAGSGPLDAAPAEQWASMQRVNLDTTRATCLAALPHLKVRGGSVVTVGARAVETGGAGAAAYAVSKAGVIALTRALAQENRAHRVRFNCIVPGTIDTAANRAAMPDADRSSWMSPQAIAATVVFLLSPAATSISGGVIPVSG